MQQIIYIFSVLFLLTTFILIKKSDEKLSLLKYMVITIIGFLCYNMFISFIYNYINIPIYLYTLSIPNYVIGGILLYFILRKKEIQSYSIKKYNIAITITVIIVVTVLTFLKTGKDLNINYVMTDSATHFAAAREFYENTTLLDKVSNDVVGGQFMTGAYVNTGILFKICEPVVGETNLYKIFILFDVFNLLILALLLYTAIEKYVDSYIKFAISFLMLFLFIMGYPLNSLNSGYIYLQLGVGIFAAIVNIIQYFDEKVNRKFIYTLLLLCNYGLFFTYCIFVPVAYIGEFIYIIYKFYKETKRIFNLKSFLVLSIIFLIPTICGICFYVIPHFIGFQNGEKAFFNIEGYIYRNCWSNFILILPVFFFFIKKKNEDAKCLIIFTSVLVTIMIAYFIAIQQFNLATYYYYKFNYILWFLLWYGAMFSLNISEKKTQIFIICYITIFASIMAITIGFKEVKITKELYDDDENITNAFDVYCLNKNWLICRKYDYTKEELELLEYVYHNIELDRVNHNILLIADPLQEWWFNGFFNYGNRKNLQSFIPMSEVEKWNNKEYKYVLVLYSSLYYDKYKDNINQGDILIENDRGLIYVNN